MHESRHVFLVLKSTVNMSEFRSVISKCLHQLVLTFAMFYRRAVDLENDHRQIGVLRHLVHAS